MTKADRLHVHSPEGDPTGRSGEGRTTYVCSCGHPIVRKLDGIQGWSRLRGTGASMGRAAELAYAKGYKHGRRAAASAVRQMEDLSKDDPLMVDKIDAARVARGSS